MSLSMKPRNLGIGLLFAAGSALAFMPPGEASAAPTTYADAHVAAGNWSNETTGRLALFGPEDFNTGGSSSSAFIQGDLTTSQGNTINYSATAQSSLSGGLKAKSSIGGDGFVWDASDPLFVAEDGSENPGGAPHWYESVAYASLSDMLSVSGAQGLTSVAFQLHIDGNLYNQLGTNHLGGTGYDAQSSVHLFSGNAQIFSAVPLFDGGGGYRAVDQMVTTGLFNVVNGQVDFDMTLTTSVRYGLFSSATLAEGGGYLPAGDGYADFFNTVTIADVFGFNAAGQRVSLFSVAGSDGTVVPATLTPPVSAVPEPATWAMMITGFGLAGTALRRRNRALAPA